MSLKMLLRWEWSFPLAFRSLISSGTSKRQTLQIKVGVGGERVVSLCCLWE